MFIATFAPFVKDFCIKFGVLSCLVRNCASFMFFDVLFGYRFGESSLFASLFSSLMLSFLLSNSSSASRRRESGIAQQKFVGCWIELGSAESVATDCDGTIRLEHCSMVRSGWSKVHTIPTRNWAKSCEMTKAYFLTLIQFQIMIICVESILK